MAEEVVTTTTTNTSTNDVPAIAKPWVNLLNQHGWPTMLLVLGAMFIWHLTSWFEPRAAKLIDEHVVTISALRETSQKQTAILDGISDTVKSDSVILKEIHGIVSRRFPEVGSSSNKD